MVFIKKLVMKGFKSFARETELPFSNGMNVIVGPNGSGKSNITDAICFVLGRMSAKSMRAGKTANMIFAGTKEHKSMGEASVKLVFDNTDKKFTIDNNEITIQRIVRTNGQGIYKINEEVKTRQEVLELLALAGIDPYGFNIVLQGEISSIIKMNSEERRKVLEEVAGISIYELRKEKSIKEMEKTDERLKEVQSILRERTAYLRNLEEERKQALKFKKLEETVKRCKASILKKKIDEKKKEISSLEEKRELKDKEKSSLKDKSDKIQAKIDELQNEIAMINSVIQKASGIEQEKLNTEISNLRANLAGLEVQRENNTNRISELVSKRKRLEEDIKKIEEEIVKLRKEYPSQAKKYQELEDKKKEFLALEDSRKSLFNLREKLNALKQISEDKSKQLSRNRNESLFILKETERIGEGLSFHELDICSKEISKIKHEQEEIQKLIDKKEKESIEHEKQISVLNSEISNTEKIKKQVSSLDICPLCKSKITEEHLKTVFKEADEKISQLNEKLKLNDIEKTKSEIYKLKEQFMLLKNKLAKFELELIKLRNIEDKKEQLKRITDDEKNLESEVIALEKEKKVIESRISLSKDTEEKYDKVFLQIQEISSRSQENLSAELEFKERDLEKSKIQIKQSEREEKELVDSLKEVENSINENERKLNEKAKEEKELEAKFDKLLDKKTKLDKEVHDNNTSIYELRTSISLVENDINNLKIDKARLDAELGNLQTDYLSYADIEILSMPMHELETRLSESQALLATIGSVNLRALEVYDKMKQEYDEIAVKVETLEKEKLEIMKIIEEIDRKKKKTLMKTLYAINELFNRNFVQLSTKGEVSLALENEQDPFSAGLDILVKVGKGKYFDVTSLSGGEQTLVALSLIFAIQEYKPYSFYIFDEVDAALDKRNSERLSSLVKRYMKSGQYIIITHNDAIITESSVLYGISMQEGISKILSLEI